MAEHPGIAKLSFTGSTDVGRKIVQASAGNHLGWWGVAVPVAGVLLA